MRAAVLRNVTVEARTVDDPVPGPGPVLVRSLACGICASDLHYMDHPEVAAEDDSGRSNYDQDTNIVPTRRALQQLLASGGTRGSLDVTPMLGRTVGLAEVPAALDASRDANGPARIVVVPSA